MTSKRGSLGYQSTQVTSDRKLYGSCGSSRSKRRLRAGEERSTQMVISLRSNFAPSTAAGSTPQARDRRMLLQLFEIGDRRSQRI